jgi:cysteine-rich repeat protein
LAVHADLHANGRSGGSISLLGIQTVVVSPGVSIEATGSAEGGGEIAVFVAPFEPTPGLISIDGALDASGGQSQFHRGGLIQVNALGDIIIKGAVQSDGSTAVAGPPDAGQIVIAARGGAVRIEAPLSARGRKADAPGGAVDISAEGEVTVAASIDVGATSGRGGAIGVRALGGVVIEQSLLAGSGAGAGGRIELASRDVLTIRGEVNSDGDTSKPGGSIQGEACDVELTSTGELSSLGSGGLNRLFGRTGARIGGQMRADSSTGRNELIRGADGAGATRLASAVIVPEPITRYELAVKSCAVCGDSRIEPPETCDDGNINDGDGCSAACRAEKTRTPTPPVTRTATAAPPASPSPTPSPTPRLSGDYNRDGCVTAADVTALLRAVDGATDPHEVSNVIAAIFSGCEEAQ